MYAHSQKIGNRNNLKVSFGASKPKSLKQDIQNWLRLLMKDCKFHIKPCQCLRQEEIHTYTNSVGMCPLIFILPKYFYIVWLFNLLMCMWWRLFQKHVMCT